MKATVLTGSLPNLLLRLWHHLTHRRQRQFGLLMGLMLVSAFAEVVSLGAVLPFLGILVAPDKVFSHPIVADMAQAWGITSADQLVLPLTVAFAAAALMAGAIRILLLWVSTRLAFASGADLSIEVYRRTLYQPYRVHVARNSSEVINGITNKVNGVVSGALALGAQRLLPTLQQIYYTWANIVGNHASLADTIALLDQPLPVELLQPIPAPLPFQDAIRFDAVRFRYTGDGPWVLDGLNLTIPKGARVGFVGSTGSGKSTTLDLLMGLLMPTEGELLVDGQLISGNRLRAWQQTIAHVPQSIYLADTTLAENIAFGVPPDTIDLDRVQRAARQAQIADFIESRPEGYQAYVGERGIRLSGGQRQRIGIARALYKQASVLVFDEATSALDNATEQSVMDAIEGLSSDLTILLIAHRLSTVRRCDTIVELEHGRVVAQGTYEQLLKCSPSFRQMADAAG